MICLSSRGSLAPVHWVLEKNILTRQAFAYKNNSLAENPQESFDFAVYLPRVLEKFPRFVTRQFPFFWRGIESQLHGTRYRKLSHSTVCIRYEDDLENLCLSRLLTRFAATVIVSRVESSTSRRPSGLRKTKHSTNSLAHRTTWLRSDLHRLH